MSFTKAKITEEITDKKGVRKRHVTVNYGKRSFDGYLTYSQLPSEITVNEYFIEGNKVFFGTHGGFNSAFRGMRCRRPLVIDYGYHYHCMEWTCWYELPIVNILKDDKGTITKIRCKKNTLIINRYRHSIEMGY